MILDQINLMNEIRKIAESTGLTQFDYISVAKLKIRTPEIIDLNVLNLFQIGCRFKGPPLFFQLFIRGLFIAYLDSPCSGDHFDVSYVPFTSIFTRNFGPRKS